MPDQPSFLLADIVRLTQVLARLLTNAAKYAEANGEIRISAHQENGSAVLRVRDNGIGIAPDMLASIFDLLVQAGDATHRSAETSASV